MMRERKPKAIIRMVAEKAVCACDGRNRLRARAHLDRAGEADCAESCSATTLDFTGARLPDVKDLQVLSMQNREPWVKEILSLNKNATATALNSYLVPISTQVEISAVTSCVW